LIKHIMKNIISIGLLFLVLTANGQVKSKQYQNIAAATMIIGTAATVHFMNTPPEYYGNSSLMNLRYKQRATVAITGMATTAITYFVVKNIKHKARRNKNTYRCQ
jgi:hypothetical protein